MCVTFGVEKVEPSPSDQVYAAPPMLVFVNVATKGEQAAEILAVKLATSFGNTVIVRFKLSEQPAPVLAIRVTV